MTAASLHPAVQHHIVNTLGWQALRPLQEEAALPILRGEDALLLAPTAGGKTEAAVFPVLSRMAAEDWRGLSVLYVCPLRALLNNLEPRLSSYAGWLGRRVGLWHGDTSASVRRRLAGDPPDMMLTTPESIEATLVSNLWTPRELYADLRAVVIDEVHSFAGDDRGWHLLAVLERLSRLAGRPLQRIGLSATVGNPQALLGWLQGSNRGRRAASVVAPAGDPPARAGQRGNAVGADVQLDYVASVPNAAKVIAALHRGEKRLVFAESRRTVEALSLVLRALGVDTFVSHSSLSADERHRAEAAFVEARASVIVATSTLELGVDVGDLDHVVQVGAPRTVASFLQRLGRTGRRPDSSANALLLAMTEDELLQAAGLLLLWGEGYVEPIMPPPAPRHVVAQQLLALCLQEGRVGQRTWWDWLAGIGAAREDEAGRIAEWLVQSGHLDVDSGMLFIGPESDKRYGRRHFLELLSVFTADPQFTVLHGRAEIGLVDPLVFTRRQDGPRVLALAGRSWLVNHVDWTRRKAWAEPVDIAGATRWSGVPQPLSYAITDAARRALLGADLGGVRLSRRATDRLADLRQSSAMLVDQDSSVVVRHDTQQLRWWTWAGTRANAVLASALQDVDAGLVDKIDRFDSRYLRLSNDATAARLRSGLGAARDRFGADLVGVEPDVSDEALRQLKFAELLPPDLARDTLAIRAADQMTAGRIAARPISQYG